MNRDHSVIFEILSKYCIWTLVDYDGYFISSKGFLPTVVDIMVTWIKLTHSHPFQFTDSWNVHVHPSHLLFDHFQFTLTHGPNIPDSNAILFFTASAFTFSTRHIHSWASFLLWLSLFIPSGAISLLFSSCVWNTCWPGGSSFSVIPFRLSFCSCGSQGKNAEVIRYNYK